MNKILNVVGPQGCGKTTLANTVAGFIGGKCITIGQLVRSGVKKQTIRLKARCKPGDELSLRKWIEKPYRSKQETLCNSVCTRIQEVRIPPGTRSDVATRFCGVRVERQVGQLWR